MEKKLVELLHSRLAKGILEESHASYRNKYFLVLKKDGGLRFINSSEKYNAITIRDAGIPPNADEFADDIAMCKMLSLLDFFSGYDQVPLAKESRDLTTIMTPLGLLRMCTLPQGATNSVAQFTRIITRILFDLIPSVCRPFMDDITVKGPKTDYGGEEICPGMRRYVVEHLINLDKTLVNIELSGCTIAGKKSRFCTATTAVVGYLCGTNGRRPTDAKVLKIVEWTHCENVSQVRGFLGVVGFYRRWIEHYAWIAEPLTSLLRKDAKFVWLEAQHNALETLKKHLIKKPILVSLDYSDEAGSIILMVDASGIGWGCALMQEIDGKRHVARYESGVWNEAERIYDATKLECRAVLYAIRRLRSSLYGVHFILETDAQVLVHQLNGSANDVPGALIMRWIAYILLFDFTVRHIPGKKNSVADGLSRKPEGPSDQTDRNFEGDIEDFIDAQLNVVQTRVLDNSYSEEHEELAKFLVSLQRPTNLSSSDFRRLKKTAQTFMVKKGKLWKRPKSPTSLPKLVVDEEEMQRKLITMCHKDHGHKGRQVTYKLLSDRFYWKDLWNQVASAISSCPKCQGYASLRARELAIPTAPGLPMEKVHFDTQYLPFDQGNGYLLEARCDLTGWVEVSVEKKLNSEVFTRFAKKIIWRFGLMVVAVVDGGPEMKAMFAKVLTDLGVKIVITSAYNPKANGIVEAGHYSITSGLAKMAGLKRKWKKLLGPMLLADRTAIRASHGKSAFWLMYGREPILPIKTECPTWRLINWDTVQTQEELLVARIRMLSRHTEDVEEARKRVTAFRKKLSERTNAGNANTLRTAPLKEGDLVLKYSMPRAFDHSRTAKMEMKWEGPFRISKRSPVTGAYHLYTLDGIELDKTFSGDHLKKFVRDSQNWWSSDADDWLLAREGVFRRSEMGIGSEEENSNTSTSSSESEEDSEEDFEPFDQEETYIGGRRQDTSSNTGRSRMEVRIPQLSSKTKSEYTSFA